MTRTWLRVGAMLCSVAMGMAVQGAEEPLRDEVNPLLESVENIAAEEPAPKPASGFSALFYDASLKWSTTYYGRARSADNRGRLNADGTPVARHTNEIHVNALGQRFDLQSGYAWGWLGFDLGGQTNIGRGNGWSEVLLHKEPGNRDRSSVSLSQAAVKTKFTSGDLGFEFRGGYTPISVGSLGTSGGLFSHSYRGFEAKAKYKGFTLGYGWADRFRNEWDDTYRKMYDSWHQNRFDNDDGRRITFVHSVGARYEWGDGAFADIGVGEGRNYRRNVQGVVSVPFDLGCWGKLTLTGYGIAARYQGLFKERTAQRIHTEYHVSGSAEWQRGLLTLMGGLGHTRSPNSGEMQFRLTAWGNSDNRNYIQTWGQLDDFVWDGQSVAKVGMRYGLGDRLGLPGLAVGASFMYTWGGKNPDGHKSPGREVDYYVEYAVKKGRLEGLALGVYAGHLRWNGNNFYGKQNRNDVKVIVSYSKSLESFLRRRK